MSEILNGVILKKKLGGVSKSAHTGFVLETGTEDLKLSREGGNPFYDSYFEPYEGKSVNVTGKKSGNIFYVTKIQTV